MIERDDAHFFFGTSWCNFQFYEVDLGLGKPLYVTLPINTYENSIILMDIRDGDGVEVLLNLSKENMVLFESKLENILSFASLV